jgi:hypothetical protein
MSVFKDDQVTYTGNVDILGSLTVHGNLAITGTMTVGGNPIVGTTPITNSLGADVVLNAASYFLGPSISQGSTGTWWASGTVTLVDTGGAATFRCKLWDGTTVISSTQVNSAGVNALASATLSGFIASPAGNIRIEVEDVSAITGLIKFNSTGLSKDSTISAIRVA